jgi:uncharacterized protein (TIGR01244 family)
VRITLGRAFMLAALAGAAGVLAAAVSTHRSGHTHHVVPHALTTDISVTDQLQLDNITGVQAQGFATLIDLRPDGEAPDQPASDDVRIAAGRAGLFFAYVPVPHGEIPASTVDALARALQATPRPVLLYCRTGRRAARTWALVEAHRPGGLDTAGIEHAVEGAGQSASDIDDKISAGVAARSPSGG